MRIDNSGNKLDEIAERAAHNFDGVGGVLVAGIASNMKPHGQHGQPLQLKRERKREGGGVWEPHDNSCETCRSVRAVKA